MSQKLPLDSLGPLKPIVAPLLDSVHDILGVDTAVIINFGIILAAVSTFAHFAGQKIYEYLKYVCISTVHINDDEVLHASVMRWMTDHYLHKKASHSVKAITSRKSTWEDEEDAFKVLGDDFQVDRLVSYRSIIARMPILLQPYRGKQIFRFEGSWILFKHNIHKNQSPFADGRERSYIQLECLGRSLAPLENFLKETQNYELGKSISSTNVFRALTGARDSIRWSRAITRPARDIRTVILDKTKKAAILRDMNEYLHPRTRQWYANHGIPYRRGFLFSGPPGSGKTSLTAALAGVFGLDIYVLSLLDPALNDSQFMRLLSEVPSRCIVLLEDVDVAGLGKRADLDGTNRRKGVNATENSLELPTTDKTQPTTAVSLSGLLNAIDGVSSHEGRILIMTTNSPDSLDKALVRPGRVDLHAAFELPARTEVEELFLSMYGDGMNHASSKQNASGDVNAADSAHDDELREMARQFAAALPEAKLSLATIQGFLLGLKREPRLACERVQAWREEALRAIEEETNGNAVLV